MGLELRPGRVLQQEIEDATGYVKRLGLREALRRLEDVEPDLWTEIVRSAVGATEPLRKTAMLDDIGGSIREDMLLAAVVAAESVRLSHYRRWQAAGGTTDASPPGLPLDLLAQATKSAAGPAQGAGACQGRNASGGSHETYGHR